MHGGRRSTSPRNVRHSSLSLQPDGLQQGRPGSPDSSASYASSFYEASQRRFTWQEQLRRETSMPPRKSSVSPQRAGLGGSPLRSSRAVPSTFRSRALSSFSAGETGQLFADDQQLAGLQDGVRHAGWLWKQSGKPPSIKWKRVWVSDQPAACAELPVCARCLHQLQCCCAPCGSDDGDAIDVTCCARCSITELATCLKTHVH
jgi:hypothetical protein